MYGSKINLTISGVPVGEELANIAGSVFNGPPSSRHIEGDGSIIVASSYRRSFATTSMSRGLHIVYYVGIGIVGGRPSIRF